MNGFSNLQRKFDENLAIVQEEEDIQVDDEEENDENMPIQPQGFIFPMMLPMGNKKLGKQRMDLEQRRKHIQEIYGKDVEVDEHGFPILEEPPELSDEYIEQMRKRNLKKEKLAKRQRILQEKVNKSKIDFQQKSLKQKEIEIDLDDGYGSPPRKSIGAYSQNTFLSPATGLGRPFSPQSTPLNTFEYSEEDALFTRRQRKQIEIGANRQMEILQGEVGFKKYEKNEDCETTELVEEGDLSSGSEIQ